MGFSESLEAPIRLFKALLAFCVALGTVLIMMPLTDSLITSNTVAGSIWPTVTRMAMWAYYIVAIVGAPMLVAMGKSTILGTLKGSIEMIIGTIGAIIIIPMADNLCSALLSDFWIFGGQITLWVGFIALMVVIPLFTMLSEEEEVEPLRGQA